MSEAGPEEQELATSDDADGAVISAIDAVATAQDNNRARLENMLEEVDSMFEEVSELMVDVTDLMRRANELREETDTATPPPAAQDIEEQDQEVEQAPAANDSPSDASVHSRHSGSDMSLDSPGSEGEFRIHMLYILG